MSARPRRWLALFGVLLLFGCDTQQPQYRAAMQQLLQGNHRAAALTLHLLAENGHAPAQLWLGLFYRCLLYTSRCV